MSHIVQIESKIHNPAVVAAACRRLQLAEAVQGTAQLFSGEATGLLVKLPGWQYPVVVDTLSGTLRYDNYWGAWGDQLCLDRFLQSYAVEAALLEARKKGYAVSEQALQDGSIRLTIHEGAA